MNRCLGIILWLALTILTLVVPTKSAWSAESSGQERLAYFELSRLKSLSKPGITYAEYRDALVRPRQYVGLLKDGTSGTVGLLRQAMDYYDQALKVWEMQAASDYAVDSLRTDEPTGAAMLRLCPNIARFHYKERDQIYVRDAVNCLWQKAAVVLDQVPSDLQ